MASAGLVQVRAEEEGRRVKGFVHVVTRLDPQELRALSPHILRGFIELERTDLQRRALVRLRGNGLGHLADWLDRQTSGGPRARVSPHRRESTSL